MNKNQEDRIKEKFNSGYYIIRCKEDDCADMRKASMEEFLWFVGQNDKKEENDVPNAGHIGQIIWEEMKTV